MPADLLRHRALKVQYPHPAFGEMVGVWTSQDKTKTKADPKGSVGRFLTCDAYFRHEPPFVVEAMTEGQFRLFMKNKDPTRIFGEEFEFGGELQFGGACDCVSSRHLAWAPIDVGRKVGTFIAYVDDLLAVRQREVLKRFFKQIQAVWEIATPKYLTGYAEDVESIRFLGMEIEIDKSHNNWTAHQQPCDSPGPVSWRR
eukprot:4872066-Amphidinium_carterae.1